jgi:hypothetical protein
LLPKGKRLGRLGILGGALSLGSIAMQRDPALAEQQQALAASVGEDSLQSKLNELLTRRSEVEFPAQDPSAEAANQARMDIAGIEQQYNNILRELKSSYRLAETEQEKERLRFMLADIEAQRDAGLQAIAEGYEATVQSIRQRATTAREGAASRGQEYGAELNQNRDLAAQRMMLQNLQQQEQFRGLGSGSADPTNEWIGLMSALGPAQQQYTQRMGDITAEGIDWMADTTAGQGLAQQADLQRLAAATRSGAIMSHQQQVAARTQREAELQRAAMQSVMSEQARAMQSAQEFNARLAGNAQDLNSQIIALGSREGLDVPGQETYFGRQFNPNERALGQWAYDKYLLDRDIQALIAGS